MDLKKRKEIRLKNYDYSQSGAYFITICTKNRKNLLCSCRGDLLSSDIKTKCDLWSSKKSENQQISLSATGKIVDSEINKIGSFYKNVVIDKYVVMPNHIHMIIVLNEDENENGRPKVAPTVSRIVQQFKGVISKWVGYS